MIKHQDKNGPWKTKLFDVNFKDFSGVLAVTYHMDDRFSEMSWIGPKYDSDLAILAEETCDILNELLRFVSMKIVEGLYLRYEDGSAASIIGEIVKQLTQGSAVAVDD